MFLRLTVINSILFCAPSSAQFPPMAMMNKQAAIAVVNKAAAYKSSASTSQAFTITSTTAGNTLIMGTGGGAGIQVSSITDNASNTWVSAGARANTANGYGDEAEIWYAANIKGGATTVTVHLNTSTDLTGWTMEVSGLNPTAPLDVVATATKTMANPVSGASVTTGGNNVEFIFSVTNVDTGITAVASPFTFLTAENGNGASYSVTTTTGSYAPSYTASGGSSNWGAFSTAAFKP